MLNSLLVGAMRTVIFLITSVFAGKAGLSLHSLTTRDTTGRLCVILLRTLTSFVVVSD